MPRKSRARSTYILAEAERIWPQVRRRATRKGATGSQVARTTAKTRRAKSAPRVRSMSAGLRSRRTSPLDPLATPVQNRSVAPVPKMPAVGTA